MNLAMRMYTAKNTCNKLWWTILFWARIFSSQTSNHVQYVHYIYIYFIIL